MTLALERRLPIAPRSNRRPRGVLAVGVSVTALLCAMFVSIGNGALHISWGVTFDAALAGLHGRAANLAGPEAIVCYLRLPRVFMAALVGMSLGMSGAAMQGLFRNSLADPYLLGVASGASLGATIALSLGGHLAAGFMQAPLGPAAAVTVPPFAFAGGLGGVLCTLALARGGRSKTTSVLLAGVVVGSVLTSLTTYWMVRDGDRLRAVFAWTLGSLSFSSWGDLVHALPYAVCGLGLLWAAARSLDALQLGEDTARTLGVHVHRVQVGVIVGASLATAAAVSFAGVIGFVGLVAPHVMRRLGTPNHRVLLPASAAAGGTLLVLADLGARTLIRPAELPVGILTTLLGGPVFLWLLRREG